MTIYKFDMISIDPETECRAAELTFSIEDVEALKTIIDPAGTDEDLQNGYELNTEEVEKICEQFGLFFESGGFPVEICLSNSTDELPYKLHTNRELRMMLDGVKPLSVFTENYPDKGNYSVPEKLFDPYVISGRFLKREYSFILKQPMVTNNGEVRAVRQVVYALPNEGWRIDAMILVKNTAAKTGWNEALERMEGVLLGYEEWQNDVHISKRFKSAKPSEPLE